MSATHTVPNILAALPPSPGKAPASNEPAGDQQPAFAAVLQQKISHNESKPAANAQAPADAKTAAPANSAETASAETIPAAPAGDISTSLPAWLNLLPATATQTTANSGAQTDSSNQDAPSAELISLVGGSDAAQSAAGQLQAAQTLNPAPLQVSDGFKTSLPASHTKQDSNLPSLSANTTNSATAAATQLSSEETANLAAETLNTPPHQAHHIDLATAEDSAASFANVLNNQIASEKPVAQAQSQATLNNPVGSQAWGNELGERLVWMSNRQESRAELTLNPPQMGKVEVSLNINGDQASVSFVSANPQVRDALESAMNRLREALAANGITLGQSNVGAESSGNFAQNQQNQRQGNGGSKDMTFGSVEAGSTANAWQGRSNAMLDVFA